jgi:hypothetical protein
VLSTARVASPSGRSRLIISAPLSPIRAGAPASPGPVNFRRRVRSPPRRTVLTRAWAAGAGPGEQPLTVDVDSTVCQVYGHAKQGAAYGYTRVLGYHPLLATRADTGEVLHARMRSGRANTARGAKRFVEELAGWLRRAGARGQLTLRADSGFWSGKVLAACRRHRIRFSVTVRQTAQVQQAIAAIDEAAWTAIDYPDGSVAEVVLGGDRLVVRRTRLVGAQATLWPNWRYHAFVTDRAGGAVELDADHRRHAVMELAIRDSSRASGCATAPRAGSWPTPPGWSSPPWPTTCCAGSPPSGWATADWWLPRPCAAGCLPLPGRLTRSARHFNRALGRLRAGTTSLPSPAVGIVR